MGHWRHYSSIYDGHGTISGTAGDLITLLDAILVNGTTAKAITSITRSGSTVTVTTTVAHGIPNAQTGWRTIAGAVETDYNGEWLVTSTGASTFTFDIGAATPSTPATGTITYKTAAAGWTKDFSGTNKAAYRNGSGATARKYMRISDAATGTGGAKEALLRGFNTMSDVDTGTEPFPTNAQSSLTGNGMIIRKSTTADGTARVWHAWADDRSIVMCIFTADSANIAHPWGAGEYQSSISGDTTAFHVGARNAENAGTTTNALYIGSEQISSTAAGTITFPVYTCGDINGFNASTTAGTTSTLFVDGPVVNGTMIYPNPQDGGLYILPHLMYRKNGANNLPQPIGRLRGIFFMCQRAADFTDGDVFTGAGEYSGHNFYIVKSVFGHGTTGVVAIENNTDPAYHT